MHYLSPPRAPPFGWWRSGWSFRLTCSHANTGREGLLLLLRRHPKLPPPGALLPAHGRLLLRAVFWGHARAAFGGRLAVAQGRAVGPLRARAGVLRGAGDAARACADDACIS